MDAVGVARQVDPHRSDRIVRSRWHDDLAVASIIADSVGVVGVVGPGRDADHAQVARGRGAGRTADGGRIEGQQPVVRVIGADRAFGLGHHNAGHVGGQVRLGDGGDDDGLTRLAEIDAGVEGAQQAFGHVELLGEGFQRRGVAYGLQLRHGLKVGRDLTNEGAGQIGGGDDVVGQHLAVVARCQSLEDLGVQNAVFGQARGLLEGGDGLTRVVAAQTVDHARREVGAVQQDLRAGDRRIGRGRRGCSVRCGRRRGLEHRRLDGLARQGGRRRDSGWLFRLWRLGG
ncbi:hypothetical protein D3C72_1371530 [compost metagenome]